MKNLSIQLNLDGAWRNLIQFSSADEQAARKSAVMLAMIASTRAKLRIRYDDEAVKAICHGPEFVWVNANTREPDGLQLEADRAEKRERDMAAAVANSGSWMAPEKPTAFMVLAGKYALEGSGTSEERVAAVYIAMREMAGAVDKYVAVGGAKGLKTMPMKSAAELVAAAGMATAGGH